jgi:hypothetical protein
MKNLFLSINFILFGLATIAQSQSINNSNAPKITFETEVIDYGTIEEASNGIREFKFTNTGKEPLIISAITGSCGCTIPSKPPKAPIMPGETHIIEVKYDTKRLGSFNKTVTIKSNAVNPIEIITIKGKIIAIKTSPIKDSVENISN